MTTSHYIDADYIIAGSGCAGLSLALNLKRSNLKFQKVILIDRSPKNKNDRTWCFWTKEKDSWYHGIVNKSWDNLTFKARDFNGEFSINPYRYNLIRGIDFYNYCYEELKRDSRFEFLYDEITSMESRHNKAVLHSKNHVFNSKYIFNSAVRTSIPEKSHINYLQHFKGWLVETDAPAFDPNSPVFMDFQKANGFECYFYYVIPYSESKALVEFTGFTKNTLSDEQYDHALKTYMSDLLVDKPYKIIETEKGVIPMNETKFINPFGENVINIGSSGGSSKPSTGYTFFFIQQHVKQIIQDLSANITPAALQRRSKYHFYDKVLLKVLDNGDIPASDVFKHIITRNSIVDTLAFLNEESSIRQDLKIISSVKKAPFLKATFQKLRELII